MTTDRQPQTLEQLTEACGQLALALAASERRRDTLYKRIRWGTAAVVLMMAVGTIISFDKFKPVYAADDGSPESSACNTLDCQIQPISTFFQMMNELMGGMIQSADVHRYMYQEHSDFRSVANKLETKQRSYAELTGTESLDIMSCNKPSVYNQCPSDTGNEQCREVVDAICGDALWMRQTLQERFPALAGQTVVDMALLVRRLRADSDEFRNYLDAHNMADRKGGPIALVADELHLMNQALRAVPIMANEMNAMNHQMSVMSRSVGSTMGRMGSMMPW